MEECERTEIENERLSEIETMEEQFLESRIADLCSNRYTFKLEDV